MCVCFIKYTKLKSLLFLLSIVYLNVRNVLKLTGNQENMWALKVFQFNKPLLEDVLDNKIWCTS